MNPGKILEVLKSNSETTNQHQEYPSSYPLLLDMNPLLQQDLRNIADLRCTWTGGQHLQATYRLRRKPTLFLWRRGLRLTFALVRKQVQIRSRISLQVRHLHLATSGCVHSVVLLSTIP
jgi:hypothetical protein